MNELETLCYIQEQCSFVEDYGGSFGFEVFDKGNRFYVVFQAILQSFGILNRNGRAYDADNIWNCIQTDEFIQHCLKTNQWIGECDHPSAEIQGQELTMNRISTPDMENSSHFIRKPFLTPDKKLLKATIQTDSSNKDGMNMAIKIVDGKIIPCFSARVFGALQKKNNIPTVNVRRLITYDWVLFPSHRESLSEISQPVLESAVAATMALAGARILYLNELAKMVANNDKQVQWLCESFNITQNDLLGVTDTGNSVVLTENGNVYVQPILDRDVRKKTNSLVKDWLNS